MNLLHSFFSHLRAAEGGGRLPTDAPYPDFMILHERALVNRDKPNTHVDDIYLAEDAVRVILIVPSQETLRPALKSLERLEGRRLEGPVTMVGESLGFKPGYSLARHYVRSNALDTLVLHPETEDRFYQLLKARSRPGNFRGLQVPLVLSSKISAVETQLRLRPVDVHGLARPDLGRSLERSPTD